MNISVPLTLTEYAKENDITLTNSGLVTLKYNVITPYCYNMPNTLTIKGTFGGMLACYATVTVNKDVHPMYTTPIVTKVPLDITHSFQMNGYDFEYGYNDVQVQVFNSIHNEEVAFANFSVLNSFYNFCYGYVQATTYNLRIYERMAHTCLLQKAPVPWDEQKASKTPIYADCVFVEIPSADKDRITSEMDITINLKRVESDKQFVRMLVMPYWSPVVDGVKQFQTQPQPAKANIPLPAGNRSAEYAVCTGENVSFSASLSEAYKRKDTPDGIIISLSENEEAQVEVESCFLKARQTFSDFCVSPAPMLQPFAVFLDWSWFTPPDASLFEKYELYRDNKLIRTFNSPLITKYTDFEAGDDSHDYFILAHFKQTEDTEVVYPDSTGSSTAEIVGNKFQPKEKEMDKTPQISTISSLLKINPDGTVTMNAANGSVSEKNGGLYSRVAHTWNLKGNLNPPTSLKINLEAGVKSANYDITAKMQDSSSDLVGFNEKGFIVKVSSPSFNGLRFE